MSILLFGRGRYFMSLFIGKNLTSSCYNVIASGVTEIEYLRRNIAINENKFSFLELNLKKDNNILSFYIHKMFTTFEKFDEER